MSTTAMPFPILSDQATNSLPMLHFSAAAAAAPSHTTTTSPSHYSNHNNTTSSSSPYRPTVSSPLSSSPVRAASPLSSPMTTPPLSPRDPNARRVLLQSSPTPAALYASSKQKHPQYHANPVVFGSSGSASSSSSSSSSSRFASRPTRPTPLNLKREAAQESRRKLFLKNVRQRAEDKRWEMRGGEQELLKLEWFSLNRELHSAKNADSDGLLLDSDIEEAARLREEAMLRQPPSWAAAGGPMAAHSSSSGNHGARGDHHDDADADAMMVDMLEQEQQAELEAMLASAPPGDAGGPSSASMATSMMKPPDSPYHSDDDAEYDALFMDFVNAQEGHQHGRDQEGQDAEMDLS